MSADDFEALDAFLDDYLKLPVKGKDGTVRVYRIEDPSAEDGLRIERLTSLAARLAAGGKRPETPLLDDQEEHDLYRTCLGAAYEPLLRELSWSAFKHVALTVMFWVVSDKETASQFWRTGQQPGKAPNRAARRAQEKHAGSASAEASTTKQPASTSGTRAGSRRRRRR
ncbi:DUF7426 family protein [Streptomyces tagetis]|uniref:DUF7426 domain-containing protein n=1 Tax=Streptomyces tagetis TaxID=2820809 RepID=A0A940XG41_9ACTN|nr:hypothetical protein [Streptomyces sp. RG38]MBQ0827716.1 hypothetical protein [Streptomyces sp. RG38]